jgi:hypothetical protein
VLRLDTQMIEGALQAAGFEIEVNERHGSGSKDARPFIVACRKARHD